MYTSAAVTGATSMIAVACIEACLAANIEVLAFVRPGTKRISRLPNDPRLCVIECTLEQLDSISLPARRFDVFFHFAWGATSHEERIDPMKQEANIRYALSAVRLAHRLGCQKFVGAGSQAEYGSAGALLSPDSPVHPVMAYGAAKYAASVLCGLECKRLGKAFNWARIFSVYGKYDNENTLINTLIERLEQKESMPMTACEQQWDYLNAADCGRAMYLIGQSGKDQAIYCVGSGQTQPLSAYIETIGRLYDTELTSWMGQLPYDKDQVMYLCADTRSLRADTGFSPEVRFDNGIREIIAYKRSRKQ